MKHLPFGRFYCRLSPCIAVVIAAVFILFGGGTVAAVTVTDGITSGNGLPACQVQWTDSLGLPRTAILVKQGAQGPGYLYSLTYQTNSGSAPVVCQGPPQVNNQYPGDGLVQNHCAYSDPVSGQTDWNSLDQSVPGTTKMALLGHSHAIIEFDMPTYSINGETVPTSVCWFFADGRSHPIFAISQDARNISQATIQAGGLSADTRSPYGGLNYDGSGNTLVGGGSYGDTYKFVTLASNPEIVTTASGWADTAPNTIPYAMTWAEPPASDPVNGADAEMGHVATLPITVQDQGSDPKDPSYPDPRGQQSSTAMLQDGSWAFQVLDYTLSSSPGQPISIEGSKLAWGGNFGRVGGFDNWYFGSNPQGFDATQFSEHSDSQPQSMPLSGTRSDGRLMAYSVFVVLGPHSGSFPNFFNGVVGQQVVQMENAAAAAVTASTGSAATSGPAGVGGAGSATASYTPQGYNPTYAVWEITAAGNAVNAVLTPAPGLPLDHPIFLIDGYTSGQLPGAIYVGDGLTKAGVDYLATLDPANKQLWITVNRSVTNSLNLIVDTSVSAPVISTIPAAGYFDAPFAITGRNFSGATTVAFNGTNFLGFTVDSPTQITATIPFLLGSGPITVTTPHGTATSVTSISLELFQLHPVPLPYFIWKFLEASLDGKKLVAVSGNGRIYTSTNAGAAWQPSPAPISDWSAVASSSDGNKLVATSRAFGGGIYLSSDAGATWKLSAAPTNLAWVSLAASTNGTKLAAIGTRQLNGVMFNLVYISNDSGGKWVASSLLNQSWNQIACSADGTKLAISAASGLIYTSTNSGTSWAPTPAPGMPWVSLALSGDGTRLLAASGGSSPGQIYSSSNGGAIWTLTSAPSADWLHVSLSADGTQWAGVSASPDNLLGTVYTATNGGAWTSNSLPSGPWKTVTFTAGGNELVALGGSQVFVSATTPAGTAANPGVTTTRSYTNTFSTAGRKAPFTGGSAASWVYWYGLNYNNTPMTNDPSMDAQGDANSGSLKVYLPFGTAGDQGVFFGTFENQFPYDGGVTLDASYVADISFDIHFAAGTPLNTAGNLGSITMSIFPGAESGGDFSLFPGVIIPASAKSGWFHATESITNFIAQEPLDGLTACDAIGFNYNNYSGYPTNPVTFWIDNVSVISIQPQVVPVVTWAAPPPLVYGTPLGAAQLDAVASVPGNFVYSPPLGTLPGAGAGQVLSVTFTPTDNLDYQTVTTNALLRVMPASLTVTANNANRAAATPNPVFTAGITGFVNGDTASVVSGHAAFSTTATTASPVGTYPIVPSAGTLNATNYTFAKFVNGTLTLTPAVIPPSGLSWAPAFVPLYFWDALAASADGTKLFAAASGGEIYVSTNSGAAWKPTSAPLGGWTALAASFDGTKLGAASSVEHLGGGVSGAIYTSSNAGATWTLSSAPTNIGWFSLASATNGSKLVAVGIASNSPARVVYSSANSGSTWASNSLPNEPWVAVASSADGTKLAVVAEPGRIYVSTNAGSSWLATSAPSNSWTAVASSASGAVLVAASGSGANGRNIYISADGGLTWTLSSAPPVVWSAVASSPDGSHLIAVSRPLGAFPGAVYTSANTGATWSSNSLPNAAWTGVASSADGTEMVVGNANGGIYISPASLTPAVPVPAETWSSNNVPYEQWTSVASSADGNSLAAVGTDPYSLLSVVYTSTNAGDVWIRETAPGSPYSLKAVAASSDGSKLAACSSFGPILISTNAGATWVPTGSPVLGWNSVASSANGSKLVAAGFEALYTSADGGATWVSNNVPAADWASVGSSADGTKLVAVGILEPGGAGVICTSVNAGANWTTATAPNESWTGVASSADGTKLVAVNNGGPIFVSADSGATWTATSSLLYDWSSVASSADGTSLVAGSQNGQLFTSTNSGATWLLTGAPVVPWASVASSADGSRKVALSGSGEIYTLQTTPVPAKALPSISWATPSPIIYGIPLTSAQLDATSGVAGTFAYSPAIGTTLAAGAGQLLAATFTPSDTADYQTVTTNVLIGVSPAPLTVTANSASRAVGQTNPVFTATLTGFVNGDAVAVVSGQAAFTTTASSSSPAGTYPIIPGAGTLAAANYSFAVFVNGALTVTPGVMPPPVLTWAPANLPLYSWDAIVSAANGTFLAAAAGSGEIYISTNSGASWSATAAPFLPWTALASSSDGTHLAAASTSDIYTSPDAGVTWRLTSAPTNVNWFAIASSSDGTKLVAVGTTTNLSVSLFYNSTDSGVTWLSNSLPGTAWTAVATSADGTKMVASAATGQIYISTNTGGSWTATSAPVEGWISVASSADGVDLVAATQLSGVGSAGRKVFTSANGGATWSQSSAPTLVWNHVFSSPDGTALVAVSRPLGGIPGAIYTSADAGATWISNNVPSLFWSSAALPVGGAGLAAVGGDQIYITPSTLITPAPAPAESWISNSVPNVPGVQWAAVTSSGNGTNLVAVGMNFGSLLPVVDTSTNAGISWSLDAAFPVIFPISSYLMTAVASSSDGTRLVAGTRMGTIYISADSGATWTAGGAPTNNTSWVSIGSSADGKKLAAASVWPAPGGGSVGQIYTSVDAGATWISNNAPNAVWNRIASSGDGTKLAAVGVSETPGLGVLATSADGGATWSSNSPPGGGIWLSIASSADGTKLVAGPANGPIYTSTNSGASWTATGSFLYQWTAVASSSDGTRLVAGSGNGQLFISTNSGATWTLTGAPLAEWVSVASSSDGSKLVAAPATGQIFTLQTAPPPSAPPVLGIQLAGSGGILISWPSSSGLVLQQTSDLAGNNWVNATQTPNDNGVTKSILIQPQATGVIFYRLSP